MIPIPMKRTLILLLLLALPATAARRRAVAPGSPYPQCGMVLGTPAVTFTHDQGETLTPIAQQLEPVSYTNGLVSLLDVPHTLMAWHHDDLIISTDAGCSWRVVATIPGVFPPKLAAARGGRVYAWSDRREFLARYDSRGTAQLKPPSDFVGLAADRAKADRVRGGSSNGEIWESNDAGETWTRIGSLPNMISIYRIEFDPNDLDHIVAGVLGGGAFVTRDGGRTWTRATGLGAKSVNVFQLVISPVDGSRVWAEGLDIDEYDQGHPSQGQHIYVSSDGGATYAKVVDESPTVILVNGPVMAADPRNRDVLYFVFGTYFGGYGTDLYRFDLSTRTLRVTHNDFQDIDSIAFSNTDPTLMYFGLERTR